MSAYRPELPPHHTEGSLSDRSRRTNVSGPSEFFRALYDGCEGLTELRALPSRAQTFVRLGDLKAACDFARAHGHDNVYLGIATRRDASGGDLLHCLHLPALFADIDFKATPIDQARAAIGQFALKPSVSIRSGGGIHLYFFLREPMDLTLEAPRAKDLLRRLALELGGDLAAAEPARILRLPGSSNYKYTPPRPVALTHLDASVRYNPIDFDSLLPAEPHSEQRPTRFTTPLRIGDRTRNSTLYKLGRSLAARGLFEPEILATLTTVNTQRCDPPLDQTEVRTIARHVATQPPSADFLARRRKGITHEELVERFRESGEA